MTQLFIFVVLVVIGIQLLGLVLMIRFYFLRKPKPLSKAEGVTIIKACYQCEDNEKENFDHFFHQEYSGPIEILFMVSNDTDPIVPIIKEYLKRYPQMDAKLVISTTKKACRSKYDALYDGCRIAKHDCLILSDSDVIVQKDYVAQMVASLREPGVSLVTTPQWDKRANNFATAFKVLGNNCDVGTFVMIYEFFTANKNVSWGHSTGFRKSEFNSFGPNVWETLNTSLADDLWLPKTFIDHGKKVVFRNIDCPVEYSGKTLRQVFDQKERFVLCQKSAIGNRYIYLLGGLLTYPEIPALFFCLFTGFSPLSLWLFAAACFVRIMASFFFELLFVKSLGTFFRYFWTIILWDLSQIYFVLNGFFSEKIVFHGKTYKIVDRYFVEKLP